MIRGHSSVLPELHGQKRLTLADGALLASERAGKLAQRQALRPCERLQKMRRVIHERLWAKERRQHRNAVRTSSSCPDGNAAHRQRQQERRKRGNDRLPHPTSPPKVLGCISLATIIGVPVPTVIPHLVGNTGAAALEAAIREPERWAIEPKVDGVRGLVSFLPDGTIETRNRRGERREWMRAGPLPDALRRLGRRLPILHDGTVLDGELIAGRFHGTMAALLGSKRHQGALEFVAFDVPVLAGVDLRGLTWSQRRERLELLAEAFAPPIRLSPVVAPSIALALDMERGDLEGIVLKDRESTYRDGSRAGWFKVKDESWYQREAWRFDRR